MDKVLLILTLAAVVVFGTLLLQWQKANYNLQKEILVAQKAISSNTQVNAQILGRIEDIQREIRDANKEISTKLQGSVKNAILDAIKEFMGRQQQQQPQAPQPPKEFKIEDFNIDNNYFLGNKDAKIVIVEFGSFTCPHCINLHPVIKDVLKKYGDKIKYVYKHYPLHGEIDIKLAELVEAAAIQGKHAEFHDKLMSRETLQAILSPSVSGYEIKKDKVLEIAKELGLDIAKFEEAIDKRTFKDKIEKDKETAEKLGVSGTPSLFINGREYRGGRSVDAFSDVIEEELKKQ